MGATRDLRENQGGGRTCAELRYEKTLGTPVPRTCAPPVARLVGVRFANRFFVTRILQRAAFIRPRLVVTMLISRLRIAKVEQGTVV